MTDISFGQPFFDQLVADTGCSGSKDVLACLKLVPLDTFQNAVNNSPSIASFMSLVVCYSVVSSRKFDSSILCDNIVGMGPTFGWFAHTRESAGVSREGSLC